MSLKDYTDDELLDEVFIRFNHCAFVGIKDDEFPGEIDLRLRRWKGDYYRVLGMLCHSSHLVSKQIDDESTPIDDDNPMGDA